MQTSEPAIEQSRRFGVRPIPLLRPLGWLARGWQDLRRAPMPGLVHGVLMALFGALMVVLAREHFWLLASAFSGFLLVAPLLATGLYAVSRALHKKQPATLATALRAWKPDDGRLIVFGMLLAFAGTGWVMTSTSFIVMFSAAPVHTAADFVQHVVLAREGRVFDAWMLLGGVLAAPVFASSVIAIPMLLDRRVGVLVAVLTSWRVVMQHPLPLALWAALIMGLTLLGMATFLLGLIVVVPWLAHSSWHAYRDLVDTSNWHEMP
jgi:uncharacterized membrane protein